MVTRIVSVLLREARVNLNYHATTKLGRLPGQSMQGTGGVGPLRVAIVRLDLIGDFVLFSAALPYYRNAYPKARLVLFGNAAWSELAIWLNTHRVAAQSQPLFDEFLGVNPERLVNLGYFKSIAAELRRADVVVNTAYSRTNVGDKLIAAAGRESVGWSGDTTNILAGQKRLNDRLYTMLMPKTASETEWERNIDLVQALAPTAVVPHTPPTWRVTPKIAEAGLADLTERTGISFAEPFVAMSPFASLPIKQWPLTHYRALIRRILDDRPELRIVILGGKDKAGESRQLTDGISAGRPVVNLVGQTSLIEATCLLYRARLSISGDTAAGHLASAVGTPAMVIIGGGHYGRFFPYDAPHAAGSNRAVIHRMECFQCNWFCKYRRFSDKEPPCLENITVDEVYAQIDSV